MPCREQPGDAVGDDAGLAAAGPGQDQQRPLDVRYRLALGVGESVEQMVQCGTSGSGLSLDESNSRELTAPG